MSRGGVKSQFKNKLSVSAGDGKSHCECQCLALTICQLSPQRPLQTCGGGLHSHREPLLWVDLDHPPEQGLAVRRDEVGHVEDPALHFLQQLPQVVVVEGQGALRVVPGNSEKKQMGLGGR